MITLGMTKAQALKLHSLLPEEKWALPLKEAISRQISEEAPWRVVVSTTVSNLMGTGASNYREDTLECGHKWRSNYVRFPALLPRAQSVVAAKCAPSQENNSHGRENHYSRCGLSP